MYIMLSDFTHYASVGIHGSRAAPPIKVARKPTWTNSVKNDEKWARKKGEIVRKWKFMLIDFQRLCRPLEMLKSYKRWSLS